MIPLTPRSLVAAANSFGDVRVPNFARIIARLLARLPAQEHDVSAAFVLHAGYWSHFDYVSHESSWPLPMVANCRRLGEFARRHGILVDEPAEGDVFLAFDLAKGGFAQAGIVVGVRQAGTSPAGRPWFDCHTIEWLRAPDVPRRVQKVIRTVRRFYPAMGDRFIRWTNLATHDRALRSA
jgi:hypothetical protein